MLRRSCMTLVAGKQFDEALMGNRILVTSEHNAIFKSLSSPSARYSFDLNSEEVQMKSLLL